MQLSKLKKGDRAIVVDVGNIDKQLKRRMFDMGITKGVEIKMKKIAPLGDPVCFELRGYELCLRKKDISNIEVKKI